MKNIWIQEFTFIERKPLAGVYRVKELTSGDSITDTSDQNSPGIFQL